MVEDNTPDICERNPEYCQYGYKHWGPCPPPPMEIQPEKRELTKKRLPQVPDEIIDGSTDA